MTPSKLKQEKKKKNGIKIQTKRQHPRAQWGALRRQIK
jgi:hypothetical protein